MSKPRKQKYPIMRPSLVVDTTLVLTEGILQVWFPGGFSKAFRTDEYLAGGFSLDGLGSMILTIVHKELRSPPEGDSEINGGARYGNGFCQYFEDGVVFTVFSNQTLRCFRMGMDVSDTLDKEMRGSPRAGGVIRPGDVVAWAKDPPKDFGVPTPFPWTGRTKVQRDE